MLLCMLKYVYALPVVLPYVISPAALNLTTPAALNHITPAVLIHTMIMFVTSGAACNILQSYSYTH